MSMDWRVGGAKVGDRGQREAGLEMRKSQSRAHMRGREEARRGIGFEVGIQQMGKNEEHNRPREARTQTRAAVWRGLNAGGEK